MSMTIQEAAGGFFEDLDEQVVRPRFERIAKALARFLEYLEKEGVKEVEAVGIEHVEDFLYDVFPHAEASSRDVSDTWHSLKRFVKWLHQRKLNRELHKAFSAEEAELRDGFRNYGASSSSDQSEGTTE